MPCVSFAGFSRATAAPSAAARRFARHDEGTFTVFSLFVFVAMLLVGGLAIDLMRHENERLRMQGVADRAVLAATMLRDNVSGATPEQILNAYFAAEGLQAQLGGRFSVVEDEETGRTVTVAPAATVPSLFMRLLGDRQLRRRHPGAGDRGPGWRHTTGCRAGAGCVGVDGRQQDCLDANRGG